MRKGFEIADHLLWSQRLAFAFAAAAAASCMRAFCTTAAMSALTGFDRLDGPRAWLPAECLLPVKSMRPVAARSAARRSCSLSHAAFSAS